MTTSWKKSAIPKRIRGIEYALRIDGIDEIETAAAAAAEAGGGGGGRLAVVAIGGTTANPFLRDAVLSS